jgi:hypothetical protein
MNSHFQDKKKPDPAIPFLGLPASGTGRNVLFKPPICGILLWQPEILVTHENYDFHIPESTNKILFEHSLCHSATYHLWLILCYIAESNGCNRNQVTYKV